MQDVYRMSVASCLWELFHNPFAIKFEDSEHWKKI